MHGTIVVADKSKTVRKMVEIALAKHPFKLTFAEDGNAASNAIKKGVVVAIIDAALPGVDGYDLAKKIKSAGDTKVILLVGRNSRYDAGRGRTAGVDDHLTKPFLTQKLVEKVFGAIGKSVPDAAIFRTSLLSIPLASGGTVGGSAPSLGGLSGGGLGSSRTPPKPAAPSAPPAAPAPAPARSAAPPPPPPSNPMAGAKTPFDDNEKTRQYEPPPADAAATAAQSAAKMVPLATM